MSPNLNPIRRYCEACGTDTEWWHVDADGEPAADPTCVRCGVREAHE